MPLGSMNTDIGNQIGAGIEDVMEIDTSNSGCAWGQFLCMKVHINISEPLIRSRLMNFDDKILWLPVKYERLPYLCFHYGVIKHKGEGYTKLIRGNNESYKSEYGQWL